MIPYQDDGMSPPSPGWGSYTYTYRKEENQANGRMQKCCQYYEGMKKY